MTKRAHIPVRERRVITVGIGRPDDARLRALAVRCPTCGRPPAHRITEITRKVFLGLPADMVAGTIQCQVDACRTIYDLTAAAYQESR
jgi:hypothetical protein